MEQCQELCLELVRDILQLDNVEVGAAEPDKREEVAEAFGQSHSRFRGSPSSAAGTTDTGTGEGGTYLP